MGGMKSIVLTRKAVNQIISSLRSSSRLRTREIERQYLKDLVIKIERQLKIKQVRRRKKI